MYYDIGIVDAVTEHLKQSPIPSLRQTSPHPATLFEKHISSKTTTPDVIMDQQQLLHHNVVLLSEFRASPYLGIKIVIYLTCIYMIHIYAYRYM